MPATHVTGMAKSGCPSHRTVTGPPKTSEANRPGARGGARTIKDPTTPPLIAAQQYSGAFDDQLANKPTAINADWPAETANQPKIAPKIVIRRRFVRDRSLRRDTVPFEVGLESDSIGQETQLLKGVSDPLPKWRRRIGPTGPGVGPTVGRRTKWHKAPDSRRYGLLDFTTPQARRGTPSFVVSSFDV